MSYIPEWMLHLGSEAIAALVLALSASLIRRFRAALSRFEGMIDKVGSIDALSLKLEAHIAQPAAQAHQPPPNAARAPMPSTSGNA